MQLTKNRMYLNNRKMKNHSPSPNEKGKADASVERSKAATKKQETQRPNDSSGLLLMM